MSLTKIQQQSLFVYVDPHTIAHQEHRQFYYILTVEPMN